MTKGEWRKKTEYKTCKAAMKQTGFKESTQTKTNNNSNRNNTNKQNWNKAALKFRFKYGIISLSQKYLVH